MYELRIAELSTAIVSLLRKLQYTLFGIVVQYCVMWWLYPASAGSQWWRRFDCGWVGWLSCSVHVDHQYLNLPIRNLLSVGVVCERRSMDKWVRR